MFGTSQESENDMELTMKTKNWSRNDNKSTNQKNQREIKKKL